MGLYHAYSEVENSNTGVPMAGVRVVPVFPNTGEGGSGVAAPIYADERSTPFVPANYCVTDSTGMYSFYIDPGSYNLDFFIGSKFIRRIEDVQFIDPIPTNVEEPYRATLSEAINEFPIGFYFRSDDKNAEGPYPNEMWIYQRIGLEPYYLALASNTASMAEINAAIAEAAAEADRSEAAAQNALNYGNAAIRSDYVAADAETWAADAWVQILSSDTGDHTPKAGDYNPDGGNTPNAGVYQEDASLGLVRKAALESEIATDAIAQTQAIADEVEATAANLNFDFANTWYLWGKKVAIGRFFPSSSGARLGDSISPDGYHYAKYSVRGLYGLGWLQNAADGFWEIDPSLMTLPAYNLQGGGGINGTETRYYEGQKVLSAVGYASGTGLRSPLIIVEDGTTYAQKIVVQQLSGPGVASLGSTPPAVGSTNMFTVESVAGVQQIFATSLGAVTGKTQFTSLGSNYAPVIRDTKVVYWSTRDGYQRAYWANEDLTKSGGSVEHPVTPNVALLGPGDSIMATGWITGVASDLGVSLVSPASVSTVSGGPTSGGGIGSQRAEQIAPRYGSAGLAGTPQITGNFTGNQIASGSNQLTAISVPVISRSGDTAGAIRTLRIVSAGVAGVLRSEQKASADGTTVPSTLGVDNYTYTFTPDAGQTLPVAAPAGTVITIDPEVRQDCCLVVHIGRNNVGRGGTSAWKDAVKQHVAAVVAAYKPFVKSFMVIGVTNTTSEYVGSPGTVGDGYPTSSAYADIVSLNSELAVLYGNNFFDVRPYYNQGTANDTPNLAYTDDGLHPNAAGQLNAFRIPVRDRIIVLKWYAA